MQCTNLGGMEQASFRLMRGLMERGHQFQVLSLNPLGQLAPLLEDAGISADGLPYRGRGGWRGLLQLRRRLQAIQADALIMTGHNLMGMLALGKTSQGRRILAIHFHHTGVKPTWEWRLIYRVAVREFDAITFPSDFIRMEAEAIYPPVAGRAHTIRNPLAIPELPSEDERRAARAALGLPSDSPIVGNAGWLISRKRFDVFLKVAAEVLKRMPETRFVIAGDGPERVRLETLATELGVSRNLAWLGWQNDLEPFYQSLDVLLFNSDWDAMGQTPLEGLMHGVPVVASVIHGGLSEVMHDEEHAHLFASHDIPGMAQKLEALLQHHELARKMARRAREHLAALCAPARIAAAYERIWSSQGLQLWD